MSFNLRRHAGPLLQLAGLALFWWGSALPFVRSFPGDGRYWMVCVGIGLALAGVLCQAKVKSPSAPAEPPVPVPSFSWRDHRWTILAFSICLALVVVHSAAWYASRPTGPLSFVPVLKAIGNVSLYWLTAACGLLLGAMPGRFVVMKALLLAVLSGLAVAALHGISGLWGVRTDFPATWDGALSVGLLTAFLSFPVIVLGCGIGRWLRRVCRPYRMPELEQPRGASGLPGR